MAETDSPAATVEVPAAPHHEGAEAPGILDVSVPLMLLTWLAFAVMAYLLYKVAWKPILKSLDLREQSIRKAIDDAEKARAELAQLEAKGRQILAEAEAEGKGIVASARATAQDMVKAAEKRAGDEAGAMVESARREIAAATEQARLALRAETTELVTTLAGKLVGAKMDAAANAALVEKLAREL